MNLAEITSMLPDSFTVVLVCIYLIGMSLKSIPDIKNWCIPWILCVVGIALALPVNGFNVYSVMYGTICGLLPVGVNQIIKQTTNRE